MTAPVVILYVIAFGAGFSAAVTRRHTFWPLLASLAFCVTMQGLGVRFDFLRLIVADGVTILAILAIGWRTGFHPADRLVLALFAVAVPFYLMPDPYRFWGGWAVVVSQFLVSIPWAMVSRRALRSLPENPWDIFDLRVRGDEAC
jgi:hypothetical protein